MSESTVRWQAQRIEQLEGEVAHLRDRIALMERSDIAPRLQMRFGLQPQQARVLAALYAAKGVVSWGRMFDVLWADDPNRTDESGLIKTHVCHLRKRIGFDTIETVYSIGYRLSDEGREKITQALAPRTEGRAA